MLAAVTAFLLGIVVMVAACGGSNSQPVTTPAPAEAPPAAQPPGEDPGSAHTVAAISTFRDRMCKCADKACADTVSSEMTQWGQAESDRIAKTGTAKVSDDDTRQIAALVEQLAQCMTKLMSAGHAG